MKRFHVLTLALGVSLLASAVPETTSAQRVRTTRCDIQSTPPGATVYVDDKNTAPLGTTPMRRVRVPRGSHNLIFVLDGHADGVLPINLERRRQTYQMQMVRQATLSVSAANASATGATVIVDGQEIGTIPITNHVLAPGRHQIEVRKEGFNTFTQWQQMDGGTVALPVLLEEAAPDTGSVMVSADVNGAPVFVDGEPRGATPTMIDGLSAGPHTIEIRPEGRPVFSQAVTVVAGERATVTATLNNSGTITVLTNEPGATINIDGQPAGVSPLTNHELSPGSHIVQAMKEGFGGAQQTVTITAGQTETIQLELSQEPGTIRVTSNVTGSQVYIDSDPPRNAPAVVDSPTTGPHAIRVTAPGHEEFSTTCEVGPGQSCIIDAQLEAQGTPIRVTSAGTQGAAELWVDGERVGPVPFEGTIPAGSHIIEVRAEGYVAAQQQVELAFSDTPREFDMPLSREGELTEEERLERETLLARRRSGAMSHSATILLPDSPIIDLSIGYPHFVELRLGVGILDFLEAGFAARTFFRYVEFEARAKVAFEVSPQFAVGGQVLFGGGIGPSGSASGFVAPSACPYTADEWENPGTAQGTASPSLDDDDVREDGLTNVCQVLDDDGNATEYESGINTWFMSIEALATLNLSDAAAVTMWLGLDFATDGWDFHPEDDAYLVREVSQLSRQDTARLRIGGAFEFVLGDAMNVWARFDGYLVGNDRRILSQIGAFDNDDLRISARLGISLKL